MVNQRTGAKDFIWIKKELNKFQDCNMKKKERMDVRIMER